MIANFVIFQLKPGTRDAFIEASLENSRGSINGPGCLATSIFPDPERENVAYVFEVFVDEDAFNYHHDQPYYKKWETVTQPMQAASYILLQNTGFPAHRSFDLLRESVVGGQRIWPLQ